MRSRNMFGIYPKGRMQQLRLFTSIMRKSYFKNDVSDTGNENIHRLTQQRQMDVYLKVFTLTNTLF